MAKTGTEPAGTSGSQFFVVTAEDAQLPPDYALLGTVTSGQDVVDKIGVVETDPSTEAPVDPVVISLGEGHRSVGSEPSSSSSVRLRSGPPP